jgi:hypothetical protein
MFYRILSQRQVLLTKKKIVFSIALFISLSNLSRPLLIMQGTKVSPFHYMTLILCGLAYVLHVSPEDGFALGLC